MSYVLNHKFNRKLRKLSTKASDSSDAIVSRTEDSDEIGLALYTRPEVEQNKIKLYIHHMLQGWPVWDSDQENDIKLDEKSEEMMAKSKREFWDKLFVGFNISSEISEESVRDLVEMGVKCVRIGAVGLGDKVDYELKGFVANRDLQMRQLKTTISLLKSNGIRVVLTLCRQLSSPEIWEFIAKNLYSEENVVGYDLINEPFTALEEQYEFVDNDPGLTELMSRYIQMIESIRKVDKITPIIIESSYWATVDAIPKLSIENLLTIDTNILENVVGYDLINEPFTPLEEQYEFVDNDPGLSELMSRYIQMIESIRLVDKITPIIIESSYWATVDAIPKLSIENLLTIDTNILVSFHFYEPMLLTQRQRNKNRFAYPSQLPDYENIKYPQMIEINDNYIADKFLTAIQWSQKFNIRLVLGEFGISREVLGADLDEDWDSMDYELGDNISTGKALELGQYNTVENSVIAISDGSQALLNKVPVDTTSDYCFGNYTNGFNGFINNFTGLLPMSPNDMDVKFLLFTCNNRNNSQNLTYLSQSNEWTTAGFNFMVGLKSTLVTHLDLIGWSLGAHVVGFAGKNVTNPNVGHITADDPAGPGFTGQPPKNRLAVGDASFVNVIHTNGIPPNGIPGVQGLGDLDALGNIDSYFNGDVLNLFLCSHVRSNYYAIADQSYAQSTGCQPIAYKCDSYDNFMS
ncbi:unnamed protein product, partial [Oppiella nova]